MKGVLDDLPSQDRSQFDGNALAEGAVSGGGSDEMMRDARREMHPDLRAALDQRDLEVKPFKSTACSGMAERVSSMYRSIAVRERLRSRHLSRFVNTLRPHGIQYHPRTCVRSGVQMAY